MTKAKALKFSDQFKQKALLSGSLLFFLSVMFVMSFAVQAEEYQKLPNGATLEVVSCPSGHSTTQDSSCFDGLKNSMQFPFFINEGSLPPETSRASTSQHKDEAIQVCEHYVQKDWGEFVAEQKSFTLPQVNSIITKVDKTNLDTSFIFADVDEGIWKKVTIKNSPHTTGATENPKEDEPRSGTRNDNLKTQLVEKLKKGASHTAGFCQALAGVTNVKNYSDKAFQNSDPVSSMKSDQNYAMQQCYGRTDQQLCMMQAMQMQGMDCTHKGPITLDFKACKKIMTAMDTFYMGSQVVEAVQVVQATGKAQEQALDQQTQLMSGDGISETYGLELQKSNTETQAQMAGQRAAINAAELATLTTLLNSMPTREKVQKQCEENDNEIMRAANTYQGDGVSTADFCKFVVYGINVRDLFKNLDERNKIMAAIFEAGQKAAENTAKMAILNDQANQIQGAINTINAYEPNSYDSTPYCEANPDDALCQVPTVDRGEVTDGTVSDSSFSVSNDSNYDDTPDTPSVSYGGTGDSSASGGFLDAAPTLGGAKSAPVNHNGAGGGSGPKNVSAPGGSSSARAGATPVSPTGARGVSLTTSGGTGSLRLSGGSGLKRDSSSSDTKNPFSKLLGKKNNSGGLLNFRSPASIAGKKGSLFFMITNRYGEVSQQKNRLLEYKAKK